MPIINIESLMEESLVGKTFISTDFMDEQEAEEYKGMKIVGIYFGVSVGGNDPVIFLDFGDDMEDLMVYLSDSIKVSN
jgi:hypothetical protein